MSVSKKKISKHRLLNEISTKAPKGISKDKTNEKLFYLHKRLFSLQNLLFAEGKHAILIILQGMDTSGKDGAIRHVFSCVNPMGCNVKSFVVPTLKEKKHDFLWRIYPHLPSKGMIQIFNRSHYEDILMPLIYGNVSSELLEKRILYINWFEQHLRDSGTIILKFFLHISQKEQKKRIQARKKDPHKKWKYDKSDDRAAKKWETYQETYETIIQKCGPNIPWHIVPSDQKWYRNYLVAATIVQQLEDLKMRYPS